MCPSGPVRLFVFVGFVGLSVSLLLLLRQNHHPHNSVDNTPNATTGAPLGESLWKLPNRRFNPEYYVQIKKPISMSQIRKKLKKGDYVNITDLTADLYVMLDNAKKAFPGTHKVYKDALKMQKLLNQKLVDADQVGKAEPS